MQENYNTLAYGQPAFGIDDSDPFDLTIDLQAAAAPDGLEALASEIRNRRTAWKAEELAELFSCSKGKIYEMVKTNRIPYIKLGSMIRFPAAAIAAWVQRGFTSI
jgi:excisionase family DNA binding protein